jgi:hypothetical protein
MGAHGSQPLQSIKDLLAFAIPRSVSRTGLGFIDYLGLLGQIVTGYFSAIMDFAFSIAAIVPSSSEPPINNASLV